MLRAAQYDRRREDLPLLRFLLQQEVTRYRDIVPWGIGSSLCLAGLLVAEHRLVDDVWLHWQAKSISFDTFLGYRTSYLLTAGVDATIAAVRGSEHPDRDRILHEIVDAGDGSPRFPDAAVDEWLVAQRGRFPDDPDAEDLGTWADHAASLGDADASRRFILAWLETQPRSKQTLNVVQFHLTGLGFLEEAIRYQAEAVSHADTGWDRASGLLGLVRLYRQAGRFADTWRALRDCGAAMPTDGFWKQAGLGRYFVKEHFLLVPLAPDVAAAEQLLDEGDRQMAGIVRLWMDGVLDAAIAAAEHAGQHDRRDRYQQLQADQRRVRDEEYSQSRRRTSRM